MNNTAPTLPPVLPPPPRFIPWPTKLWLYIHGDIFVPIFGWAFAAAGIFFGVVHTVELGWLLFTVFGVVVLWFKWKMAAEQLRLLEHGIIMEASYVSEREIDNGEDRYIQATYEFTAPDGSRKAVSVNGAGQYGMRQNVVVLPQNSSVYCLEKEMDVPMKFDQSGCHTVDKRLGAILALIFPALITGTLLVQIFKKIFL